MRVVVEASAGPRAGGRWLLRPGERLKFGRTERSDIIIGEDSLMSSSHFRVSVDHTSCTVEDLSSTNGTWIGDKQIAQACLVDGDEIIAGKSTFLFKIDARNAYERTTADAQSKLSDSRRLKSSGDILDEQDLPDNLRTGNTDVDVRLNLAEIHGSSSFSSPSQDADSSTGACDVDPPSQADADRGQFPIGDTPGKVPRQSESLEQPKTKAPSERRPTQRVIVPAASTAAKTSGQASSKMELQAKQCVSGLWHVQQTTTDFPAKLIVDLLVQKMSAAFIIDAGRTGIELRQDDHEPGFLMANLPPEVAVHVSPRLMQPISPEEFDLWMNDGWGQDGMIALISHVEIEPMLLHLRSKMNTSADDSDGRKGIVGLCWPSVLRSVLENGKPAFAKEVIEPMEAIIVDSEDGPGGWMMLGDQRMLELLANCNLAFSLDENDSASTVGDDD